MAGAFTIVLGANKCPFIFPACVVVGTLLVMLYRLGAVLWLGESLTATNTISVGEVARMATTTYGTILKAMWFVKLRSLLLVPLRLAVLWLGLGG
jgi:hypothetical protein